MKKERTTQGFGLAVFSLILLGLAMLGVLSSKKICVIASIIAILSVVFSVAAYFEARRAKGSKSFALIALIITILGTYLVLVWAGTINEIPLLSPSDTEEVIAPIDTNINDASKLMEKAEEFEKDSLE